MPEMPWVSLRNRRAAFIESRRGDLQGDHEFAAASGSDGDAISRHVAFALRQQVAMHCGVPRECIHSSDPPLKLLNVIGGVNWFTYFFTDEATIDYLEVFLDLEDSVVKTFNIDRDVFVKLNKRQELRELTDYATFGDWVRQWARTIAARGIEL